MEDELAKDKSLVLRVRNEISRMLQEFRLEHSLPVNHPYSKLSAVELTFILFLGDNGPQNMSSLASHLRIPLTTATSMVDRLVKKKFVVRKAVKDDRRVVLIDLQTEGLKLHKMAKKTQLSQVEQMLAHLNPSEKNQFLFILSKIVDSTTPSSHE